MLNSIRQTIRRHYVIAVVVFLVLIVLAVALFIFRDKFSNIKIYRGSVESQIDLAKESQKNGKNDEAIEAYQEVLKQDPTNKEASRDLATLFYQAKKYTESSELWSNVVNDASADDGSLNMAGNAYRDSGNIDEAENCYKRAIDKGNMDSAGNLITMYNIAGNYDKSISFLGGLLQKYPGDKNLVQLLASSYYKKGDTKKASQILAGTN